MTVTVRNEIVKVTQRASGVRMMGVPDEADTWWAECSECGKRSRAFLVGLVVACAALIWAALVVGARSEGP